MSADKPFPPSIKKLQDARKRGEIPRSAQVNATAVFVAVLLVLLLSLPWMLKELAQLWRTALNLLHETNNLAVWIQFVWHALFMAFFMTSPVWIASILGAIAGGWGQAKGLVAFKAIEPKVNKLNPVENLKNIFSMKQFFDLLKRLVEVALLTGILASILWFSTGTLLQNVFSDPLSAAIAGAKITGYLFLAAAVLWIAVSAADYGIQYFGFMRQQRMNFEEIMREYKEMEGDPYMKSHRRSLQQEMANSSGGGLQQANVLIANPTHVVVGISYSRGSGRLPTVVVKACDSEALALRSRAQTLGIAVVEDISLARRLYAEIGVGDEVSEFFYEPIARVLLWVEQVAASASRHRAV
jgi:type III secretion protein U